MAEAEVEDVTLKNGPILAGKLQYDVGIGYRDDIERAPSLGTARNSGSKRKTSRATSTV